MLGVSVMPKILISSRMFGKLDSTPLNLLLQEGFEIVNNPYPGITLNENQLLPLVEDIDAAIVGDDFFTASVLNNAKKLKVISKYGVGVDRIDLKTATQNKIAVTNAPGSNKNAVADLTFTLMLALSRQLRKAETVVKSGEWKVIVGGEIYKKKLGIIGLGQIGREVVKRAKGFNMDIIAYDLNPDQQFAEEWGIRLTDAETIFSQADFITLHLPSLPSTKHFVDSAYLSLMKPTSYFVNTARGDLVNEEALLEVLLNHKIAGAALDTFEVEPPVNNPFIALDNVKGSI